MADVLRLADLTFERGERLVLRGIDWSVEEGTIAAVVGANGCGKSTLLRLMSGYLWPTRGAVWLLGHKLGEYPLAKLRQRVGMVEANAVYPFDDGMTGLDVVVSGYYSSLSIAYVTPSRQQVEHARQTLESVGLGAREGQLYGTLSTGERMRVLIARALVRRPELLVLDEPTAGLDLPAREAVLATVSALAREAGRRMAVLVTHQLEELLPGTANVLLLSRAGQVVAQGAPHQVLTSARMTAAYEWPIQVHQREGRFFAHTDPATWRELC